MNETELKNKMMYDILNSIAKGQDRVDNLEEYKKLHNTEYGEVAQFVKDCFLVTGSYNVEYEGKSNDRKLMGVRIKHAELTQKGIAKLNQLTTLLELEK